MVKKSRGLWLWGCIIVCFALLFGKHISRAKESEQIASYLERMENILSWERTSLQLGKEDDLFLYEFLEEAGETDTDWYAFSIGRSGYQSDYGAYLAVLEDILTTEYNKNPNFTERKVTDLQRLTLTVGALGGDVHSFGKEQIDLLGHASYLLTRMQLEEQGFNAVIWALITMNAFDKQVPKTAKVDTTWLLERILKQQNTDGSFSLDKGNEGDVDVTAMAIQAMAPFYKQSKNASGRKTYKKIENSVDQALHWLSEVQLSDGGFESWDTENVESSCQVLLALCSLNRNAATEKDFTKNGNTLMDAIFSYQNADGGFSHEKGSESSDGMAGQQVYEALAAFVRLEEGKRTLFDLREESAGKDENPYQLENIPSIFKDGEHVKVHYTVTKEEIKQIEELPETVTSEEYTKVLVMLEHLEHAENRKAYKKYEKKLLEKQKKIQRIKEKISLANELMMKYFYPVSNEKIKEHKKEWKQVKKIYQELGAYDQKQIIAYETIEKKESVSGSPIWYIGLCAGGIFLLGIMVVTVKKFNTSVENEN